MCAATPFIQLKREHLSSVPLLHGASGNVETGPQHWYTACVQRRLKPLVFMASRCSFEEFNPLSQHQSISLKSLEALTRKGLRHVDAANRVAKPGGMDGRQGA